MRIARQLAFFLRQVQTLDNLFDCFRAATDAGIEVDDVFAVRHGVDDTPPGDILVLQVRWYFSCLDEAIEHGVVTARKSQEGPVSFSPAEWCALDVELVVAQEKYSHVGLHRRIVA